METLQCMHSLISKYSIDVLTPLIVSHYVGIDNINMVINQLKAFIQFCVVEMAKLAVELFIARR